MGNPDTGASVVVRINDRGPFVAGRDLDLSEAAATVLGLRVSGTARVNCRVLLPEEVAAYGLPGAGPLAKAPALPPPPIQGSTCRIQVASFRDAANARATQDRLRLSGIPSVLEMAGAYTRVVIPAAPAAQVEALSERLRSLGYRDLQLVWTK